MSVATVLHPPRFAGLPLASWAFAIRIWIGIVLALYAGFWLQLESASSSAVCVAILALPTRGQALEKAGFRFFATVIGVTASIGLVGMFSQARDLLLLAFALWVGLSVYVAGLLDGNRAYAAVLSGYTVAIIAIEQIDTPNRVFDAGLERGAAIAVGIAAIALVNDLLAAPDRHRSLATQFVVLHRRVRDHVKAVLRGAPIDPATTASFLREIATLRSDMASLATESGEGWARSAAARGAAVALVAQLHSLRVVSALPIVTDPAFCDRLSSALDRDSGEQSFTAFDPGHRTRQTLGEVSLAWAAGELLRRDQEVRDAIAALESGVPPKRTWRTPFYGCHRLAFEAGMRAAVWLALSSVALVLAGWPDSDISLTAVAIVIGLGATTPNPRGFTMVALIAMPVAAILTGVLEFLVLDGVTQFPLLALGLAPFMMGAALLMTLPNQLLSALGRLNLIFILVILQPSNPPSYNPQAFLDVSLFICLAVALLLAAQLLLPPVSEVRRARLLLEAARRELTRSPSGKASRYAPEEALFRDAMRISQIVGQQRESALREALRLFDQAGALRLCEARLIGLNTRLADQARKALAARNVPSIRRAASELHDAATIDGTATAAALYAASLVLENDT